MEGGIHPQDTAGFKECLVLARKNPYILRLAFSAGIGGFLFGYDTGVISGALLYIREDFDAVKKKTVLQETIVSMAIAGAIVGAAIGGWLNDKFGRKATILCADFLFFIGAVLMAAAPNPGVLILGRIFVGIGVGMASFTSPLYISETSPAKIRGALVSTNAFLITGGQFLSYLINLGFTKAPGTWRWMLGIATVPALLQFILMLLLPESPRWLYRKGRVENATIILGKIYPPEVVEEEVQALKESIENEEAEKNMTGKLNILSLLTIKTVRRGLIAGVGVQVLQQLVGINTVMYYSPTIVQFAGIASNQTALLLSLITSGLNAFGSIVSIYFVDRTGRKKLMALSLIGIVVSLSFLAAVFQVSTVKAPKVGLAETSHFTGLTCPAYDESIAAPSSWNCMKCLKANPSCGFCAAKNDMHPGACLISNSTVPSTCHGEHRVWYTQGCPSKTGWLAVVFLAVYIIFYSPGMGSVPWIVNSEIYPLRYRGICGGIAATSNWISNLAVSQSFLSLTQTIGTSWTFLIFAGFSLIGFLFVLICVPETKGLPMEEIEKTLEKRNLQLKFWEKSSENQPRNQA